VAAQELEGTRQELEAAKAEVRQATDMALSLRTIAELLSRREASARCLLAGLWCQRLEDLVAETFHGWRAALRAAAAAAEAQAAKAASVAAAAAAAGAAEAKRAPAPATGIQGVLRLNVPKHPADDLAERSVGMSGRGSVQGDADPDRSLSLSLTGLSELAAAAAGGASGPPSALPSPAGSRPAPSSAAVAEVLGSAGSDSSSNHYVEDAFEDSSAGEEL